METRGERASRGDVRSAHRSGGVAFINATVLSKNDFSKLTSPSLATIVNDHDFVLRPRENARCSGHDESDEGADGVEHGGWVVGRDGTLFAEPVTPLTSFLLPHPHR